ncbi:MAG: CPBP family intramembrane metalloprotease, partial [Acidobacteria bacterium]|nr:CPBP family intramembrane metalloprotease [Acidobacteriota bacterium]
FILHRFEQRLGGATAGLMLFSTAFGAGHLLQGMDVAVTTAVLGFFWGGVFLWRRSIIAPVVCHSGFNAAEIIRYAVFGSS